MAFIGLSRPKEQTLGSSLSVGSKVPALQGQIMDDGRMLVVFLRHVGCPFAERAVKEVRAWSARHTNSEVVLVSHGSEEDTKAWLNRIGGEGEATLIVDPARQVYGAWGLGYSKVSHFLGFKSLLTVMALLFKGIRNRKASGTRWQTSATFLIEQGKVVWMHVPNSAGDFSLPPSNT